MRDVRIVELNWDRCEERKRERDGRAGPDGPNAIETVIPGYVP